MASLPGYRKLSPSELEARGFTRKSERYLAPNGAVISRRQFENRIFQKAGYSSWSQYQRLAKKGYKGKSLRRIKNTPEYERFVRQAQKENLDTGPDSEFTRLFLEATDSNFDLEEGGKFDEFLTYIGYRQPDWDFNVGDTPMGYKG